MKNLILALSLASAAAAGERFTPEQRAARFSYDLGADTIDVSSYPKVHRDNYALFQLICAQCHTLARAINAPVLTRADWRRYVTRMHARTTDRLGTWIDADEARKIIDFLAYDSRRRKVQRRAEFEAESRRLAALFGEVKAEQARLARERDDRNARQTPMGPVAKPRP